MAGTTPGAPWFEEPKPQSSSFFFAPRSPTESFKSVTPSAGYPKVNQSKLRTFPRHIDLDPFLTTQPSEGQADGLTVLFSVNTKARELLLATVMAS